MTDRPSTYRLRQTVAPAQPKKHAWQSLNHRAALQLWRMIHDATPVAGHWFAVRITADEIEMPTRYGETDLTVTIDLVMMERAPTPPRFEPDYREQPTVKLIPTATKELMGRARRALRRITKNVTRRT